MEKFRTLIAKGVSLLYQEDRNGEDRSQDNKIRARLDKIIWDIVDLIADNYEIEQYFIENCCGNVWREVSYRYEAVADFIDECFCEEFY